MTASVNTVVLTIVALVGGILFGAGMHHMAAPPHVPDMPQASRAPMQAIMLLPMPLQGGALPPAPPQDGMLPTLPLHASPADATVSPSAAPSDPDNCTDNRAVFCILDVSSHSGAYSAELLRAAVEAAGRDINTRFVADYNHAGVKFVFLNATSATDADLVSCMPVYIVDTPAQGCQDCASAHCLQTNYNYGCNVDTDVAPGLPQPILSTAWGMISTVGLEAQLALAPGNITAGMVASLFIGHELHEMLVNPMENMFDWQTYPNSSSQFLIFQQLCAPFRQSWGVLDASGTWLHPIYATPSFWGRTAWTSRARPPSRRLRAASPRSSSRSTPTAARSSRSCSSTRRTSSSTCASGPRTTPRRWSSRRVATCTLATLSRPRTPLWPAHAGCSRTSSAPRPGQSRTSRASTPSRSSCRRSSLQQAGSPGGLLL